jgi:UDP-N-acetylglucosamine 2-epimerase
VLATERPDAVVVYGDTNSTLAGALAAAKLTIAVAHVEAGLRSFDRRMPEEVNRIVVDHLAAWRFVPTPAAVDNLRAEGVTLGVELVGDLMQDLAARVSREVRDPASLPLPGLVPGCYLFSTIHRAENRHPASMRAWAALLRRVARAERPVVLPLHPGTRAAMEQEGISCGPHVLVTEPLGYRSSLALQLHAAAVLTDSGGVQREAAWLGVPCLVLRSSTEWIEAVASSGGRMVVVGLDADRAEAELDRLAPSDRAPGIAAERARTAVVPSAGAAEAIAIALEALPR